MSVTCHCENQSPKLLTIDPKHLEDIKISFMRPLLWVRTMLRKHKERKILLGLDDHQLKDIGIKRADIAPSQNYSSKLKPQSELWRAHLTGR